MFKIFFDFSMTVALNQHNPYVKKPLFPVGGKKKHCIENCKSICPKLNMWSVKKTTTKGMICVVQDKS